MRRIEDACVDCGARGGECLHCSVTVFECDKCGRELDEDEVYGFPSDDEDYCIDCLKSLLDTEATTPSTCPYCHSDLEPDDSLYHYSRTYYTREGQVKESGGACNYCFDEAFQKGED